MTNKRALAPWKESYDKPWQYIKKQRHHFADKGPYSWCHSFSSSHVWMWKLVHKGGWEPKNWYFWTVVLEKTLESPLDCKEIKPDNYKGNQPWIFIGSTDAEAPILWLPDAKSWLIGNDPDAGKDWGQEEKGATKDEMVGWHHRLNGHEFEETLGNSEGHGSLACCSLWGRKELDMTERLNNNERTSESVYRRNISQHNKSHLWQTHGTTFTNRKWWKAESISSKIRNKTKMSTLTTFIQHSFGSSGHSNQGRKKESKLEKKK